MTTWALPAVAVTPVGAAGIVTVPPLPPELPLPDPLPLPLPPEFEPEPVPVDVLPAFTPPAQPTISKTNKQTRNQYELVEKLVMGGPPPGFYVTM
jgi:hypothetical protein